jgi:hypothetical protein
MPVGRPSASWPATGGIGESIGVEICDILLDSRAHGPFARTYSGGESSCIGRQLLPPYEGVRDYLVKNFRIDDTGLKTIALGKTDEPGKVEIYVYPQGREQPARVQSSEKSK